MKFISYYSLIVVFLLSCNKNHEIVDKKEVEDKIIYSIPDDKITYSISDTVRFVADGSNYNCTEDELGMDIINYGIKPEQLVKIDPKPAIVFNSGYFKDWSIKKYQFSYNDSKYEFIDKFYEHDKNKINKRSIYLNDILMNVFQVNGELVVNSMELMLDYTESDIYYFKNNPSKLLIVSKSMNWVGKMTEFSFYQLIDSKAKCVVEFIKKE